MAIQRVKTRKTLNIRTYVHLFGKIFWNIVVSICGSKHLWPRFLRKSSILFFLLLGRSGCEQSVSLDSCQNNLLSAADELMDANKYQLLLIDPRDKIVL